LKKYLLARLSEPSSAVSLGLIAASLIKLYYNPADDASWTALSGGLVGFFLPEKSSKGKEQW
jgi:hypothetical protein